MALIELTVRSQVLITETELYVILPENKHNPGEWDCARPLPTLYLLHGMSDDHSIWLRRTSIERYADEHGVAVVMPCGQLSFYTDMHCGEKYWQFLTEELPAICRSLFPQMSRRREDTFVAGLSMGGYGALKCGLRAPQVFSHAAGLSAACDMAGIVTHADEDSQGYWQDVFGPKDQVKGSFNDLFAAAEDMAKGEGPRVNFYMWCGTEDFLYEQNVRFRDHMNALGLPLLYEESPGDHQWKYWDDKIQAVLSWLPLGKERK